MHRPTGEGPSQPRQPWRRRGRHAGLPGGTGGPDGCAGEDRRRRADGPAAPAPLCGADPDETGRLREGKPVLRPLAHPTDARRAAVWQRRALVHGQAFHRILVDLRSRQRLHGALGPGGRTPSARQDQPPLLLRDRHALPAQHAASRRARHADARRLRR